MDELFDKLIIRLFFTLFIILSLFLYKYAHTFMYPTTRRQIFSRFYPSKNPADTIHFFSRLLAIGIIYSQFFFFMSDGIIFALFDFFVQSIFAFATFLLSVYVIESIVLYNFDFLDEIIKKKNMSYAVISFSNVISLAIIMKTILAVSKQSIILLFLLWLFALVLLGLATKSFNVTSKLSFNKLLIQKNLSISFSYMGFIFGWTLIISSSLFHQITNVNGYVIEVVLKILLSAIIFPIFRKGIIIAFKIKDDFSSNDELDEKGQIKGPSIGYGVYEGVSFFTSCYLTTIITGHINFGTFYPVF